MKTSVKKFSLFVLAFAVLALCAVVFSTVGIRALAEETENAIEISGDLTYVSVETVTYDSTSKAPKLSGFTAAYISTEATTYNLVEGVDFEFREGAVWQFKGAAEGSTYVDLDTENNDFVFAGKYKKEINVKEGTVYTPGDTPAFVVYEIKVCDPSVIVASSYKVVIGMTLNQVKLPIGWSIKKVAEEYDIDVDERLTSENASGSITVVLSFEAPAGTEDNFKKLEEGQTVSDKTLSYNVISKPEIIFKGTGTNQVVMVEEQIAYNNDDNIYSGNIITNTFTRTGYDFRSFKIEGDGTETEYSSLGDEENGFQKEFELAPAVKIVFMAQWDPRKDTKYKVEHYRQGLSDENSYQKRVNDTQTFEGTTEELITIGIEDDNEKHIWVMEGFTYNTEITRTKNAYSGEVKADGSLILKLYYTRDLYKVAYIVDDELVEGDVPVDGNEYKYEERFSLKKADDLTKPGYTFTGWTDGQTKSGKEFTVFSTTLSYTMIAPKETESGDKIDTLTFTAKFVPNTNTPYTVKHIQVLEDNSFNELLEKELYGETDSTAVAMVAMTGYIKLPGYADENGLEYKEEGVITADGTLVLAIYYKLVDYKVTFMLGKTPLLDPETFNINDKLTLPEAPSKVGYIFSGWSINGVMYQPGEEIEIVGDIKVDGVYAINAAEQPTIDNSNNNVVVIERPNKPLSGGGIAGITIASAFVLALATFSIIWFAVKKKSFKDLSKLFARKNKQQKSTPKTSVLDVKPKSKKKQTKK